MKAIQKCPECGCPQIDQAGSTAQTDTHFKGCDRIHKMGRSVKVDIKKWILRDIQTYKNNIEWYKELIEEAKEILKVTCLDEVYETRWDCNIMQREAA